MAFKERAVSFRLGDDLFMINLMTASFAFLAVGIFTSVTLLGAHQILLGIATFYFAYLAYKNKNFTLPWSAKFLLIFSAVMLLSSIVNHQDLARVSKNYGRIKYEIIAILSPFAIAYFLQNAKMKVKSNLINLFLFTITIVGVLNYFLMYINGELRINGLTNTMRYGYGTAMVLIFLLGFAIRKKEVEPWLNYRLLIWAIISASIGLYFTYTRGAMLGLIMGLPFVLGFWKRKIGYLVGVISFSAVLVLGGFYLFGSGKYHNRFLTNKSNNSDQKRMSQWQSAVIAFKERPILGWGPANFHSQVQRIKIENNLAKQDYIDHHSHNMILETLAGTGILGFIFFFLWIIFWIYEVWRGQKWLRDYYIPFFVTLLVVAQFEVITDANNLSMVYFLYGLSMAINKTQATASV